MPEHRPSKTSARDIEAWLIAYIARELGRPAEEIDRDAEFVDLGLGSRHSVLLAGDLEDWLDLPVPPTAAWDHPSIEKLAAFLAAHAGPATAGPDEQEPT